MYKDIHTTRQDKTIFYLGSYTTWYINCFPNNFLRAACMRSFLFVGTPSIFESLILKEIDLYFKTVTTHVLHIHVD